jgi:hypothetical protein
VALANVSVDVGIAVLLLTDGASEESSRAGENSVHLGVGEGEENAFVFESVFDGVGQGTGDRRGDFDEEVELHFLDTLVGGGKESALRGRPGPLVEDGAILPEGLDAVEVEEVVDGENRVLLEHREAGECVLPVNAADVVAGVAGAVFELVDQIIGLVLLERLEDFVLDDFPFCERRIQYD